MNFLVGLLINTFSFSLGYFFGYLCGKKDILYKQKRHRNRVQRRLKQTLTHKNQFYNSTIVLHYLYILLQSLCHLLLPKLKLFKRIHYKEITIYELRFTKNN